MASSGFAVSTLAVASFGALDWAVVAIYFVGVMAVGLWAARGQGDKRDYFLGGRELSWWVVGLSIVATETSALTFIGVPAYCFGALSFDAAGKLVVTGGNMLFIQLIVGYVLGRIIIAAYIVPLYFNGDVYTPFQLINRAFGRQTRFAAASIGVVGMSLGAGVRVLVSAIPVTIVMQTSWPSWTLTMSIMAIMLVALVYTAIGGIKAVVWTDMVQYFIFVGGGLFALYYIPSLLTGDRAAPSGAEGWSAVAELSAAKLDFFRSGFLTGDALSAAVGDSPTLAATAWAQIRNIFGGPFNIIMGIFPTTVGIILAFGFDQMNVQRVLGCRNVSEGRRAMILSAILIFPQFLMFLLIGACLYAFYAVTGFDFGNVPPWNPAKLNPETGLGSPTADYVFPLFIINHVPTVLKGFLIAGLLAAAMSSVSSVLSALSSIAIIDFWRPIRGTNSTPAQELYLSRVATIFAGVLLVVIAFACEGAPFLLDLAFKLAGLTAGAILGAFLFGMWKKRGHAGPVIAGMTVSFFFMIIYNMTRSYTGIRWPWDAPIGMLVCFAVCWLASIGLPEATERGIANGRDEG